MSDFPWSSALVTGASSGIGFALTARLAAAGVPTVAVARRADRLEALASAHPGVEVLAADLHDPEDRARVAARLGDPDAPIELLVNNAGFGVTGPFAVVPAAEHLAQIDLNVSALVALTHAALTPMRQAGRGWVLNVSSVAGFAPSPRASTYAATKAFVTSFSESLAEEVRGDGIVVSACCPGLTRSEFHERANAGGYRPAGGGVGTEARSARVFGRPVPELGWMSADAVAAEALAGAARGRVIVVSGAFNRTMVAAAALLPRAARRRVAALVLRER